MKRNIVAIAIVMSVLMSGMALGASDTNEVYDFDDGEELLLFVPTNQSVEFWNSFTGVTLKENDWLNVTYVNMTGNSTSSYYHVEDVDEYINITWNMTVWADALAYGIFNEQPVMEVYLSVNNKTAKRAIPMFPDFEEFEYDGMKYTVVPLASEEFEVGDLTLSYVEEYEYDYDEFYADNGINWTETKEPAVVVVYDDVEYPLGSYGLYVFEDEEVAIQVGELAADSSAITYVLVTNYDVSTLKKGVSETRRYWKQDGASFMAKYITGTKNTFMHFDAGDYTIIDVPAGNIARLKIGVGAWKDYRIQMNGDSSYSISRFMRAYGVVESVSDLADTDSDILMVNGVSLERLRVISFVVDEDDGISFDSKFVFKLDNTFDFGVKNWYAYGNKKTTWKVAGFRY